MKRILLILLSFVILIFMSGCQKETTAIQKEEVTINLPNDYSVNGYRNDQSYNSSNEFSNEELDKIIDEILKNEENKSEPSSVKNESNTSKVESNNKVISNVEEDNQTTQKVENNDNIEQEDKAESTYSETTSKSYCGNKNSKIFHYTTCGSVKKMLDSNKVYLQNRNEFIQNGYTPCKKCNP